ncbi:orexin/Hypocretin receptor type 1-like [Babylonia areolata]|uniref:orexin/Hypocretin receptor type 1-like n=1 Tax=Babylonia areolata TaxID=304850 RepID=UPI003FD42B45
MENATELNDLNRELQVMLIPSMVLIVLIFVVGGAGNAFVLYNYFKHFKRTSSWYFIVTLAAYDYVICSVLMPFELHVVLKTMVYTDEALCKVVRTLQSSSVMGSSWTLMMIAVHTYLKICHPFLYFSTGTTLVSI